MTEKEGRPWKNYSDVDDSVKLVNLYDGDIFGLGSSLISDGNVKNDVGEKAAKYDTNILRISATNFVSNNGHPHQRWIICSI